MNKVYVIFQKSDHPIGKLTEPVRMFLSEEKANYWANAKALTNNITYVIASYNLSDDEEISLPKQVMIEMMADINTKEATIVSITPEEETVGYRTDYFKVEEDTNLERIQSHVPVVQSENAYNDTIKKFKEDFKAIGYNFNNLIE